jgi:Phosphodiester glycosidase
MTKPKLTEQVIEPQIKSPVYPRFARLGKILILVQVSTIAAIAAAIRPSTSAPFVDTVSHPFAGVSYLNRRLTGRPDLNMHIVRIDLTRPGLRFQVTKPAPDGTTPLETTLDYTQRVGAQIGINGNFFQFSPSMQAKILGPAASQGRAYGSDTRNAGLVRVNFTPNSAVSFLAAASRPDSLLPAYNLLSGFNSITSGNVRADILDKTKRAARSAIGLTQDGRQLVLFVVDGPASGVSRGMTQLEMAERLRKDFGVYSAANLDGGGSSTLVFCPDRCQLANLPSSTVTGLGDRVVGNNLAIFVPSASPK